MHDELKSNFDVLLENYPSGMYVNSLLAGKYFGVNQDYIVVGNGAAELIKIMMEEHSGEKTGVISLHSMNIRTGLRTPALFHIFVRQRITVILPMT